MFSKNTYRDSKNINFETPPPAFSPRAVNITAILLANGLFQAIKECFYQIWRLSVKNRDVQSVDTYSPIISRVRNLWNLLCGPVSVVLYVPESGCWVLTCWSGMAAHSTEDIFIYLLTRRDVSDPLHAAPGPYLSIDNTRFPPNRSFLRYLLCIL